MGCNHAPRVPEQKEEHYEFFSTIGGKASMSVETEEERADGLGIDARNSVSESVHVASTDMLVVFGTIRVGYCAAIGQSRFNNDFGRAHKNNDSSRKSTYSWIAHELQVGTSLGRHHNLV